MQARRTTAALLLTHHRAGRLRRRHSGPTSEPLLRIDGIQHRVPDDEAVAEEFQNKNQVSGDRRRLR